jgi:MFS family permease
MHLSEEFDSEPVTTPTGVAGEEAAAPSPAAIDPEEASRGLLVVLKNTNFLALWGGQVFSQLADKVYLVMAIAIVESQFQSANQSISGWVSAIMLASTIPAILFGSFAGVYVDRWPKRRVLVVTNLLRGILVLALPLLIWASRGTVFARLPLGFELLLLVGFLVSILTQFFAPAEQATISGIVEKQDLLAANSLYTTTMMGSLVVGFAVGEPLLALADHVAAGFGAAVNIGKEILVGGSYTLAGLLLMLLRSNSQIEAVNADAPHVLADLQDGIRYLGKRRAIREALIQLVVLFSVFASITVVAVRLAEILPEIRATQFGFLLAAGGLGMGLGALLLGYLGKIFSRDQMAPIGLVVVTASLLGMAAATHSLTGTMISIILMGVGGAMVAIPMQTTIQSETPPEMRGKVFGLQNNAVNIALSLPLVLTGVVETLFGVPAVLLGLGAIVLLLTWYLYGRRGTESG